MTWRELPVNYDREKQGKKPLNLTLLHQISPLPTDLRQPILYSLIVEVRVRSLGYLAPFIQQNIFDLKSGCVAYKSSRSFPLVESNFLCCGKILYCTGVTGIETFLLWKWKYPVWKNEGIRKYWMEWTWSVQRSTGVKHSSGFHSYFFNLKKPKWLK